MSQKRASQVTVREVAAAMHEIAPPAAAQEWDNVGLQAGTLDAPVRRVLLAIDLTHAVVDEALKHRDTMVVAYHPPIFRPITSLVHPSDGTDACVLRCLTGGISIYATHTALDAAPGGTNDVLARLAGVKDPQPPVAFDAPEATLETGILRVGNLPRPTTLGALARKLAKATHASAPQRVGPADQVVKRLIVLVGSAGTLPLPFVSGSTDAIVTGEIRHHDALAIERLGAGAVALGHWASERPVLAVLADRLTSVLPGVQVLQSQADRDPLCSAR